MPDGGAPSLRQRVEGVVYREFTAGRIADGIENDEERLVRVSFSSEEPYLRRSFWEDPWIEILGHDDGEVDLSRLLTGAPVLYNHIRNRENRIGVVREAAIEGGRGIALLQISDREDVADVWNDMRKGILCNISVAYQIHERVLTQQNEDGADEYRVTLWEPFEISPVDIPADPTVGVGRDLEPIGRDAGGEVRQYYRVIDLTPKAPEQSDNPEDESQPERTGQPAEETAMPDDNIPKSEAERKAEEAAEAARKQAKEDERKRRADILESFKVHIEVKGVRELQDECLDDDECTPEDARKKLLAKLGERHTPTGSGHFQPGEDAADKFRDAAIQAIESRAGVPGATIDGENPYRGYRLEELARQCLTFAGQPSNFGRMEMVGRAFMLRSSGIGLTPSDFPAILADVANKSVKRGFAEAPETWSEWCRTGNLTDFKAASRVNLSEFEDLELVPAGDEYAYGKFTDERETIQLGTYGKIFPITRQAIINDDLNAFTDIPMKMGRAAARVPGDLAYAVLTTNPLMSDGVALFAAGHNNLGTAGAPNVTTVGEARRLMGLQTGVGGNANGLNIRLGYIIVPLELEDTTNVLRTSEFDPANTGNSRAQNPVRNTFETVAEARLSANSATQWYGAAADGFDTVEVAFLDGIQEPRVEEQAGWTVDGNEFKVGIDVAAAATEYRTLMRNAGA